MEDDILVPNKGEIVQAKTEREVAKRQSQREAKTANKDKSNEDYVAMSIDIMKQKIEDATEGSDAHDEELNAMTMGDKDKDDGMSQSAHPRCLRRTGTLRFA